jgi:hypothetical protein
MMQSNFPDRAARLEQLLEKADKVKSLPLFHEVAIPQNLFEEFKLKCHEYLVASLKLNSGKTYQITEDFIDLFEEEILSLPNMTPNGLILPKKEILDEYNSLHRVAVKIFNTFNLNDKVSSIHAPINIRVISGKRSEKDLRPRASSKMHSDIWAGEFSNTTMIFFSALGDIVNNGVEFYEPDASFLNFCKPLNDYLEGAELEKTSKKYDCGMRDGYAYFTDPFLLHRTIKKTPKLRLSIDFRFVPNISCPSDIEIETERHKNYISLDEWREIGLTKVLHTDAVMASSKADTNANRMNAYAAEFSIKDV